MRSFLAISAVAVAVAATTVPGPDPGAGSDPGSGSDPGAMAGAEPAAAPLPVPPGTEVVADGLDNPRGIIIDADGVLWVAEAGGVPPEDAGPCLLGPEGNEVCYAAGGAITRVDGTTQERVASGLRSIVERTGMRASGPHDLAATADGSLYVLFGLGADPAVRADNEAGGPEQAGRLFLLDPASGELTEVADIAGFEASDNPDGGVSDSNPYSLAALDDGSLAITDAGGNSLLHVTPDGTVSALAVFPDRVVEGLDGSDVPMNAVPTGLAVGADGEFYVGQLTGFPFPIDGANVFTVTAEGGEPAVLAEGFTNIIDVAVAPNGDLYVLEINSGGMLNIDPADPSTLAGDLIRVAPDGTQQVVVAGLVMPTSMAIADDGTIYVTNGGVLAGAGQVLTVASDGSATSTTGPGASAPSVAPSPSAAPATTG